MGAEANCHVSVGGRAVRGKARLETDVLELRGPDLKLSIPFKSMTSVTVRGGALVIDCADGIVSLELGGAAAKWSDKILHPPSRLDKLGVKPDWTACAIGAIDRPFLKELGRSVASLSIGRVAKSCDAVFFGVTKAVDLKRMQSFKSSLKPNGALWIVRPKGRAEVSEQAVMAAGKAAGLVDVKVVGFSPTHTAEKFVIPVAQRPRR